MWTAIEALVAPGRGLKHQWLATATPAQVGAGIRAHLQRMEESGITHVLDFREQGVAGLRVARESARGRRIRVRWLGRPDPFPVKARADVAALVSAADGLGLPSVADWGRKACEALAEAAHVRQKPVALHVSEARHESVEDVLALDPDLVVHACHSTAAELGRLAEADVPVAVCPTSNAYFGLRPPVESMERAGIRWFLGTDNAMLGSADLVAEVRQLVAWYPTLAPGTLFRALTTPPEKAIYRLRAGASAADPTGPLLVIDVDARGRPRWDRPPLVATG